ncbi:hypothetical protein [Salinibacterium sp.]|uniref:hypothetical protein n=1 Tax=Salinibacterium sp. TaxID=1915057 RepID=UPI00286A1559|nr:hypothetical protein [Salinibacterium sp.]
MTWSTSRRLTVLPLMGFGLLGALLIGCTGSAGPTPKQSFAKTAFIASNFVDPRLGANEWLPLIPGMQWVREGTTLIGNREVPHKVVTTVTDVIREIQGVKTVLVHDQSTGAGQVVQQSLDYLAQDKDSNIWVLGVATEQYEAGRFIAVDEAWLSGVDGARGGILMPTNPTTGTPPWQIARPPGANGDAAEFLRTQPQECVPFACFDNVLVIREGKAGALDNEFKYFALGVGQIRNEPRSASRHEDIEFLINVTMLSPEGLGEASAEALRIDAQAAAEYPVLFGDVQASRLP